MAANISKPGATQVVIDEVVNPDFEIINLISPQKGVANLINSNTIQWTIPSLGTTTSEGAALEFFIQHTAKTSGTKKVNESIAYQDAEGNVVVFPEPEVEVNCGTIIVTEECPKPVEIEMNGCQDFLVMDLGNTYMRNLGRIIELSVTVKNVCPNKRVALAVILSEVDSRGNEYPRGMQTITIPAHKEPACRDVLVRCIHFVLPEDLNVSAGVPGQMCRVRNLRVRFISHPIDYDFKCCELPITSSDIQIL